MSKVYLIHRLCPLLWRGPRQGDRRLGPGLGGVFDFGPAQLYSPKLVDSLLTPLTVAL